jgi:polyhydroxybutyrate depolymerase
MKRLFLLIILFTSIFFNLTAQTNITDSLVHQSYQRKYMVHLPTNFTTLSKRPLVVSLHGGSGTMINAQGFSLLNPIADQNNFIVAWPQGYGIASPGFSWADGRNTSADKAGIDDIGFINKLIDGLIIKYNIDTNKIYICGFSNGGFMVQRIACQSSDRFAAMASLGSSMDTVLYKTCKPTKPIPMAFFNGTSDPAMPYYGGALQNPQVIPVVPVDTTVQFWIAHNHCKTKNSVYNFPDIFTTDNSKAELYNYTNCDGNAEVKFYKLINGGHTWPGVLIPSQASTLGNTNRDINGSLELWYFFKNHTLKKTVVEIKEKFSSSRISIYPNPASTSLHFSFSENDKYKISIENIFGQNLIKTENQNHLDISNLQSGIYLITILHGLSKQTQTFIKK